MKLRFLFACLLFVSSCSRETPSLLSLQDKPPVVLEKNGTAVFQYWDLPNTNALWDTVPGSIPSLQAYRDSVRHVVGNDWLEKTLAAQSDQFQAFDTVGLTGDQVNAQLVHSGRMGRTRPLTLLEAQLLNYQVSRYPLLSHPTEFHGFILQRDSSNQVRIYFAASDQPWPPKPTVITEAIKVDLKQGWRLAYHLHNHYEPKEHHYVGILAPSVADAQFFEFLASDFQLVRALITNGFHTVEIDHTEFTDFRKPKD